MMSFTLQDHSLPAVKQLSLALRAAVWGVREEEEGAREERGIYRVSGTSGILLVGQFSHVTSQPVMCSL